LSLNALNAGEIEKSWKYINESEKSFSLVLEEGNVILADVMSLKGQIAYEKGNFNEAKIYFSKAIEAYSKIFNGPHYSIGICEVYLSSIAANEGNFKMALNYLDKAKINYDSSYKNDHINQGDLLIERSIVLRKMGKAKDADFNCNLGLNIIIKNYGANHDYYKESLKNCTIKSN
jgi:tetratricopeptide (TPR) repeat protein